MQLKEMKNVDVVVVVVAQASGGDAALVCVFVVVGGEIRPLPFEFLVDRLVNRLFAFASISCSSNS